MLPDAGLPVPASLMRLLAPLAPLFTAPSFRRVLRPAPGLAAARLVVTVLVPAGEPVEIWGTFGPITIPGSGPMTAARGGKISY
jgi:hypothetical protein